ncbi:MAG: two-component sensor histidine kinase [bacterium]|nr:MAG: two-component sensor histidine kinase [bacterium]
MAAQTLKNIITGPASALILSLILLAALLLLSIAAQNSAQLSELYAPLLVINLVGIFILLVLNLSSIYKLIKQVRAKVIGSRLTLRMVGMFTLLAFLPLSVVYYISIQFLSHGIDSWFDVRIEQAMSDATLLGQVSLKSLKEGQIDTLKRYVPDIEEATDSLEIISLLDRIRRDEGYNETAMFTQRGRILASSSMQPGTLLPSQPDERVFTALSTQSVYVDQETGIDGGEILRIAILVPSKSVGMTPNILQAIKPIPLRFANLESSINAAIGEYDRLLYLRGPIKFGFIMTLSLVSLMTLLLAVWTATFSARRLASPLRELAEGTQAVADGNYNTQLPVTSNDEFGILLKSFNRMTQQISKARENAQHSQTRLVEQHTYLETILKHLSSGVLSFDANRRLRAHNSRAGEILDIEKLNELYDQDLHSLALTLPSLKDFFAILDETMSSNQPEWNEEVVLFSSHGKQVLFCRGTRLPGKLPGGSGYVFVFDDITGMLQAQRDAAWGEVARRLAHEIKNPLTPIQLSAERIRQKYLHTLNDSNKQTLDRATRTISEQVESMKEMVNAFSNYAQPVSMNIHNVDLNQLLADVVELHKGHNEPVEIKLSLDDSISPMMLDSGRMRQVFNNLIVNATHALKHTEHAQLLVSTQSGTGKKTGIVTIRFEDNGPGIQKKLLENLFEPYVTSKEKGSGLGLAIVKKIIDEHGGTIWVKNMENNGSCFTIQLPLKYTAQMSSNITYLENDE